MTIYGRYMVGGKIFQSHKAQDKAIYFRLGFGFTSLASLGRGPGKQNHIILLDVEILCLLVLIFHEKKKWSD